jgi:hypothetical protein
MDLLYEIFSNFLLRPSPQIYNYFSFFTPVKTAGKIILLLILSFTSWASNKKTTVLKQIMIGIPVIYSTLSFLMRDTLTR